MLVPLVLCNFLAHYSTMIHWYEMNPLDGTKIARNIQVGLPPDPKALEPSKDEMGNMVYKGFKVPEADREVIKVPLSMLKDEAVNAEPINYQYKTSFDPRHSSPKKLIKAQKRSDSVNLKNYVETKLPKAPFASSPFQVIPSEMINDKHADLPVLRASP